MKLIYLLCLSFIYSSFSQFSLANTKMDFCQEGSESCTFVLLSNKKQRADHKFDISSINNKRANLALSPFSTFKVVNSLIGLELGVITNAKQILTYDKAAYPEQPWWPPVWKLPQYNLSTAFKFSMVPIYRQLAKEIGKTDMLKYLNKIQYGNNDISSGIDNFWLNGSMKISAIEQVLFLQKLYYNQFEFQAQSIVALKEIMLVESNPNFKLYAKTGAGKVDENVMLGWYIGFVENASGVHFFAFNFDSENYTQMKENRINIATNHLKRAGVIE